MSDREAGKRAMGGIAQVSAAIDRVQHELRDVTHRLGSLGRSFDAVGNPLVGSRLRSEANILNSAIEVLRQANSQLVDEYVRGAEQSSQNMLLAALAGVDLARKRADEKGGQP